eukprot:TRINITY_DN9016_c0_g1_i1.p1 TRINITY_DN9016_c0_g1~~TRINITY_DN9016_c0_g1_i1.p1  ORF type:complete len:763 (+),score=251.13 TRINITY_DN9016_c0_g1_i1:108-2396(+)
MEGSSTIVLQAAISKLSSEEELECEYGLRVIINTSVHARQQDRIRAFGGIESLIRLLSSEKEVIQMLAAWALSNLALDDENKLAILRGGGVKTLIPILAFSHNADVITKCMWLLTNLTTQEMHRQFLARCGYVKLLANLLKFPDEVVVLETFRPLGNMMLEADNQKSFVQEGGLLHLVELLGRGGSAGLLVPVIQVLSSLSRESDIMRKIVVAAGSLPPLVYLLTTSDDELLLEPSLRLLITLSLTEDNEVKILQSGALLPVVDKFNHPKVQVCELAALLLSNLSCNELIRQALRYSGLVTALAQNLTLVDSDEILEQSIRVVTNLALDDINRMELLDAGVLPLAAELVKTRNPAVVEAANWAVNNLSVPVNNAAQQEIERKLSGLFLMDVDPTGKPTQQQPERPGQRPRAPGFYSAGRNTDKVTMRRGMTKLNPQLMRREKIARELLATEESYVRSLKVVVNVFLGPLLHSVVEDNPIIPADDIKSIFSIIEIITKVNEEFLRGLTAVMNTWSSETTLLGDLILDVAAKCKVYTRYVNNYENTMNTYGRCVQTYPRFAALLEDVRMRPDVKNLDLLSYLIMPIQRVPRYILLLTDLLKHTPAEHPDHARIEEALLKLKDIADYLNEQKRNAEGASKVVEIQDMLLGNEELVLKGRRFVRQGMLIKRDKKSSEYCYFFLFTDILLHTVERASERKKTDKKKGRYKVVHKISRAELKIVDVADTDVLKNAFKIAWNKESLVVATNTPEEKIEWTTDLQASPPR